MGTPNYARNGQYATVVVDGNRTSLGRYGSPESFEAYQRVIAELDAGSTCRATTVAEVCQRYLEYAEQYYTKDGRQTSEIHSVRRAVKTLIEIYGSIPPKKFTPTS